MLADVLGFADLVKANPDRWTNYKVEGYSCRKIKGTSESHSALVWLFWNLRRALFTAGQGNTNPQYSHVASDSMLLVYDGLAVAIAAAAQLLRWSLLNSPDSLRIGIGCGTFTRIEPQQDELLKSTTTALYYGTAVLEAIQAEKLGKGRGPCIVLSETCEEEPEFQWLVKLGRVVPARRRFFDAIRSNCRRGYEVNYLACMNPAEHTSLREGLQRQKAEAVTRCRKQGKRYDNALDDFHRYQKELECSG